MKSTYESRLYNPSDDLSCGRSRWSPCLQLRFAPVASMACSLRPHGGKAPSQTMRRWSTRMPERWVRRVLPGHHLRSHWHASTRTRPDLGDSGDEGQEHEVCGRQGLTVALCAGLGDVGYCSKWALEVRLVGRSVVPLAVGTPIGQVVFHQGTPTASDCTEARGTRLNVSFGEDVRFLQPVSPSKTWMVRRSERALQTR